MTERPEQVSDSFQEPPCDQATEGYKIPSVIPREEISLSQQRL